MKNKFLIPFVLISSISFSYADYSAKFFIDGVSFKNASNPTPPPSNNCVYDVNNMFGAVNVSDNTNAYGVGIGESFIYYDSLFIGRDTTTENYPAGLSLGTYVESMFGYDLHEICADDFSIYPDVNNPTPPSYTYNEISIPNGSVGSANGSNGFPIFGFAQYNTSIHPTMPNIGTPIPNGSGNRLMLEIYEYEPTIKSPVAVIYIVNGNERINDTNNPGNIGTWWNQYDSIILSNSDESFTIKIPNNGGVIGNWARAVTTITSVKLQQIKDNPNIITKIKFRNK